MMRYAVSAVLLGFVISLGSAFAQTPTPPAKDKKEISRICTEKANAKGLHGKERKKFRSECKKAGGNI
jgi:hypothetical protein